jgi:hypothetical protein
VIYKMNGKLGGSFQDFILLTQVNWYKSLAYRAILGYNKEEEGERKRRRRSRTLRWRERRVKFAAGRISFQLVVRRGAGWFRWKCGGRTRHGKTGNTWENTSIVHYTICSGVEPSAAATRLTFTRPGW